MLGKVDDDMKSGNWIPLSKGFLKFFPKDRPFSEIEAAFSLQVALDCKQDVTVSGFAATWKWSRKRVNTFLKKLGAVVVYHQDTKKFQNQRGQIALQIRDRKGADKEQIRLIDSSNIQSKGNRKGADKGQKGSRKGITIKEPNTNPKKREYPAWLNLELWNEFILHRKQTKSPMSGLAETKLLNKLEKLISDNGISQEEIVNQSIENGWRGLFEVKKNKPVKQSEEIKTPEEYDFEKHYGN
jgi:hypothetical protein